MKHFCLLQKWVVMHVWRSVITTLLCLLICDKSLFVSGNTFFSKKLSTPFELSNLWAFGTLLVTVWHNVINLSEINALFCRILLTVLINWSISNMTAWNTMYGRFHWCIIWACNLIVEKPSCYKEVVKIHRCCYHLIFHPTCSWISLKSMDWESHELCLLLHQTPFQVGFLKKNKIYH